MHPACDRPILELVRIDEGRAAAPFADSRRDAPPITERVRRLLQSPAAQPEKIMSTIASHQVAVLFLDLQDNIVASVKTIGRHKLRKAVGALAKLCALHDLPAFLSAVPPGGPFLKSVLEPLDEPTVRPRTFTSAFADTGLVDALKATGRKSIVIAGVASEIVVLRTALDAREAGFEVQILIDACGGFSERTEAAAWNRATANGVVMSSVVTLAAELAGDFTTEPGAKTLALIYEAAGK